MFSRDLSLPTWTRRLLLKSSFHFCGVQRWGEFPAGLWRCSGCRSDGLAVGGDALPAPHQPLRVELLRGAFSQHVTCVFIARN